jgi:hypothetical protein
VLVIFSEVKAVLSIIAVRSADLTNGNLTDQFGAALGIAAWWPILVVLAFYPFLFAAALGFRLLVPTFAGAPPRAVAVVVTTWPIFMGSTLILGDLASSIFFACVAIAWAMAMPLPRKSILEDDHIKGPAMIGLMFGAFLPWDGMLIAIAWCGWRLYKRNSVEAAITAVCAAVIPAVLIAFDLPSASSSTRTVATWGVEILILGAIAVGGLVLSRQPIPEAEDDEADDSWDEESDDDAEPETVTGATAP